MTSSSGAVTDSYEYDAYGNSFTVSGLTPNEMMYRGEQFDSDLGLYYLRARYYNPLTDRFMSRDPEDGKLWDPKSLHKYLYADGDPVNQMDPLGRESLGEVSEEEEEDAAASESTIRNVGKDLKKCFWGIATTLLGAYDISKNDASLIGYGLFYIGAVQTAGCLIEFYEVPKTPSPVPPSEPPPPPCQEPLECSPPWGPHSHGPGGVPDADLVIPKAYENILSQVEVGTSA